MRYKHVFEYKTFIVNKSLNLFERLCLAGGPIFFTFFKALFFSDLLLCIARWKICICIAGRGVFNSSKKLIRNETI